MNKKVMFAVLSVLVFGIGFFVWNVSQKTAENKVKLQALLSDNQAIVVASRTCGCCKLYAEYLRQEGFDVDLQEKSPDEVEIYKNENQVPQSLRSCHTSRIGGYIVEGHIPMEAIEKLLKDKPNIKGIGMAGMPIGSPGMPGQKNGSFIIDVITNDGEDGGLFLKI
ncbi:hypothetical protein HY604_04860 [Candidatus Peregrinibacteria bacterium]|nr:hypothetical protein [Candidatus Peregrinibacteria bacterium]